MIVGILKRHKFKLSNYLICYHKFCSGYLKTLQILKEMKCLESKLIAQGNILTPESPEEQLIIKKIYLIFYQRWPAIMIFPKHTLCFYVLCREQCEFPERKQRCARGN